MARWRTDRCWPVAAVLALACGLSAAQGAPGQSVSLLDRYRIHPVYDTTYDVMREQKTWKQKLILDRRVVLADMKGQFEITRKTDKRRNDLDQTTRRLGLDLERRSGSLRVYTQGTLDSDRQDQTSTGRRVGNNNLTLGGEMTLLGRAENSIKFKADGGFVSSENTTYRKQSAATIVDSTSAAGLRAGTGLTGTYLRGGNLKLSASAAFDGSQKDSRTIHAEIGSSVLPTRQSATDRYRKAAYSCAGEWTRFDEAKVQLRGDLGDDSSQYYYATGQAQETRTTQGRNYTLLVDGTITPTLYYTLNATHVLSVNDYKLNNSDSRTRNTDLKLEAGYTLGRIPILTGSVLIWDFTVGGGDTQVQTGDDYRSERATMSAEARRPIGSKLDVTVKGGIELTQDFYAVTFTRDQDMLIHRFSIGGDYRPSGRFQSSVSYRVDSKETILVDSLASAGSNLQEDYLLNAKYDAQLPASIRATQTFQVQASYRSYTYAPEDNSLARTNRVLTAVDMPLWGRTMLKLTHDFLNTDSGSYVYASYGGGRAYARAQERLQQKLQVTVLHDLTPEIYVRLDERFDITYLTAVVTGVTTRQDKLNLTWAFGFKKDFPSGFRVDAMVSQTSSTQEDTYWNIRAAAGMRF
jgi:hypothetical protein